jgi:HAD superfamily hydrolase (TIGR01509 family)
MSQLLFCNYFSAMKSVLVLDAMGVIYQSADDVAELLVPFVRDNGGISNIDAINELYTHASLGRISATKFWQEAGVSPELEDEYLAQHRLSDGLLTFLRELPDTIEAVWCLSNDVAEWSYKLREKYCLGEYFSEFIVSGDVGHRKPDAAIYRSLLDKVGCPPSDCVFVDDRPKNLDAAALLGFRVVHFATTDRDQLPGPYPRVQSFQQLAKYFGK